VPSVVPHLQIPITKFQIMFNPQTPITKNFWLFWRDFGHWEFAYYLDIGAWDLVLHKHLPLPHPVK
jgi:hypothetical protein